MQLDAPLTLCLPEQFHPRACCFEFEGDSSSSDSSRPNAFQILMSNQRRVLLPKKVDTSKTDQRMYDDIIDLLASWNIGWMPDTVETVGKNRVKVLSKALWHLDPHHGRFRDHSLALPACFEKFQGYNDWKRKKERCPQLCQAELDRHIQALSTVLSQPWNHKPNSINPSIKAGRACGDHETIFRLPNETMKVAHSSKSVTRPIFCLKHE